MFGAPAGSNPFLSNNSNLSSGLKVFGETNNLFGTPGRANKGKGKEIDDDGDPLFAISSAKKKK